MILSPCSVRSGSTPWMVVVSPASTSAIPPVAMHAARFAHKQSRPVLVVDFPASGNQVLLANGAVRLQPDLSNIDAVMCVVCQKGH